MPCGFPLPQYIVLLELRQRYLDGRLSEMTPGQCRLAFAKWLVSSGRVNEGWPGVDAGWRDRALLEVS